MQTRSLTGAVYHEATESWMVPQKDPYTLANFQAAYDNLAAQKSVQSLAAPQAREFAASKRLEATHYALKIFPHNEKEQWRIEMMDDYNQGASNPSLPYDEIKKCTTQTALLGCSADQNSITMSVPITRVRNLITGYPISITGMRTIKMI